MMRKDGAATGGGGNGLVLIGIGVAVAIAAITTLVLRQHSALTEDQLAALVPPAETSASPTAPVTAPAASPETSSVDATQTPMPETIGDTVNDTTAEESATAAIEDMSSAPDADAPTIDEVRLDADGMAVVAGRAKPGSEVEVIVDGDVVAKGVADTTGAFAALGFVTPNKNARVLSLRATEEGQIARASRDEVIIAPAAAPKVAAQSSVPVPALSEARTNVSAPVAKEVAAAAPAMTGTDTDTAEDSEVAPATPVLDSQTPPAETGPADNVTVSAAAPEAFSQAPSEPAVVAPAAASPEIALLRSSEEGVSLMQAAPLPSARIVLDTIGYSETGVVQLSGRAGADAAEVRVYLNNGLAATFAVTSQGSWRGDVPDVEAGVYTLRADAVDAGGAVTSRLETPFKREELAVLAAATDPDAGPVSAVTVQTGDTLWAIARKRYGEGVLYVRVFDANRTSIRDPDLIYPGQVFDLPVE